MADAIPQMMRHKHEVKKFVSAAAVDKLQGVNRTPPENALVQHLQYPADIGASNRTANYMLFTTYKRHPAKLKQPSSGDFFLPQDKGVIEKGELDRRMASPEHRANARAKTVPGKESLHMKQGHTKSGTTIALYMPATVNAKYAMKYDDAPVGFVADAIYSIIKDIQAGAAASDAIKKNAGKAGTGVQQLGLKMIDAAIPGAKDLVAMERGMIIAPRTEVMFQGINKRTFSFNFTFIPKSNTETETIDKIIYEFKRAMTPAFKTPNSVRELNFPEMFAIAYMHREIENQYINKIGKCFLENCSVAYGGERFVTFAPTKKGAAPNKIFMNLNFREIEIVEQSRIDQGY